MKYYMKLYLYFILSLGLLKSQTQNISGQILDSKTKIPISNVNIFIENSNIGTITDKKGYFNYLLMKN